MFMPACHIGRPPAARLTAMLAAVIVMARMKQRATGRIIQTLFAQFVRFRDGRIVEFREFLDSFDAVEQVLGREIKIGPDGT